MDVLPLGSTLRLPDIARSSLGLKAGDIVSLTIIKGISAGVWAVGLKGSVFRARSTLSLAPGERYTAEVVKAARGFELKLIKDAPSPLAASVKAAGLPGDALSLLIVASLMKHSVTMNAADIRLLRQLLGKMKGDLRRNSRILGMLISKGVRADAPGLEELVADISFGEEDVADRRREERRSPPRSGNEKPPKEKDAPDARVLLSGAVGRVTGGLAVSNHLAAGTGEGEWIIIPYRVANGGEPLEGTVRVLYYRFSQRIRKTVVVAVTSSGKRFQFILTPYHDGWRLGVTSGDARYVGLKPDHWPETAARLAGLGVIWEEMIRKDGECDGFDEGNEAQPFKRIDTEG
jgi:hypothetical protein